MARNGTEGTARLGDIDRTIEKDPRTGFWTRRDTSNGRFTSAQPGVHPGRAPTST